MSRAGSTEFQHTGKVCVGDKNEILNAMARMGNNTDKKRGIESEMCNAPKTDLLKDALSVSKLGQPVNNIGEFQRLATGFSARACHQ